MPSGRTRTAEQVKRTCPIHGYTEHRRYYTKVDGYAHHRCYQCEHVADDARRGKPRGSSQSWVATPEPVKRPVCPTCWTELPLTGECSNCD